MSRCVLLSDLYREIEKKNVYNSDYPNLRAHKIMSEAARTACKVSPKDTESRYEAPKGRARSATGLHMLGERVDRGRARRMERAEHLASAALHAKTLISLLTISAVCSYTTKKSQQS